MKNNYRKFYTPSDDKENDLPFSEYMRFIKLWDILVLVADVLVMVETMEIVFYIDVSIEPNVTDPLLVDKIIDDHKMTLWHY